MGVPKGWIVAMDLDLEVPCPACGAVVKTTMKAVALQRTVRCRRGHLVNLKDQGGGARKTQRSLDDLGKTLKKLNRTLKF